MLQLLKWFLLQMYPVTTSSETGDFENITHILIHFQLVTKKQVTVSFIWTITDVCTSPGICDSSDSKFRSVIVCLYFCALSYSLPHAPVFFSSFFFFKTPGQKQHFSLPSLAICAQSLPQPSQCLCRTAKYPALEKRHECTLERQNRRSFCRQRCSAPDAEINDMRSAE